MKNALDSAFFNQDLRRFSMEEKIAFDHKKEYKEFYLQMCIRDRPYAEITEVPEGCEIAVRRKAGTDGAAYLFVLNYQHEPVQITRKQPMRELTGGKPEEGTVTVEKFGVKVYRMP